MAVSAQTRSDPYTRLSAGIASLAGWRRYALAAAAGAVSSLSLAPFGWFPVLWATFPIFIWLLDGAVARSENRSLTWRLRRSALVGWSFGFGYFVGGLWWLGNAFLVEAADFAWALPLVVAAFPAGLALFWGIGAAAACILWRPGWRRVLVFAVVMTAAEWLRGTVLTGFPWNAVGYAMAPSPVMMQSASLVGLWGLTLAAFLVFASPAVLADRGATGFRTRWLAFALSLFLLAAHVVFGVVRLATVETGETGLRLRIVQPGLKQEEKWSVPDEEAVVGRYFDLSREDGGLEGIDILVWPESAFPFLLGQRSDVLAAIGDLLPEGTTLITGAARGEPPREVGETGKVFNSIQVVDDLGEIVGFYDKVHLVPFGEYLPFQGLLEGLGLRQLVAVPQGFSAGDQRRSLAVEGVPAFTPLICYEVVFPGETVSDPEESDWLLNVTNDGWFGDTPGPHQHFQQAQLRAVAEGLPLVRAANTGISAIVDPLGRVLAVTRLDTITVLDGPLPRRLDRTVYAYSGDWSVALALVLALLLALSGRSARSGSGGELTGIT